jgi:acyl carrier protein
MKRAEVREQLREIFTAVLDLRSDEVVSDLSPDSCERWDSLHHIHLVNAIQETFGISLDVEQQVEILTFELGDVIVWDALKGAGRASE